MPQNCCVPGCFNADGGHKFPKDSGLRRQWILAVKRVDATNRNKLWQPSSFSVVCHRHFQPDDYIETLTGDRKRLRRQAVPTRFDFKAASDLSASARQRQARATRRCLLHQPLVTVNQLLPASVDLADVCTSDVAMEVTVDGDTLERLPESNFDCSGAIAAVERQVISSGIQCSLDSEGMFTIDRFIYRPKIIKYYTGFKTYEQFMLLYSILGPCVDHLSVNCHLSTIDQLFLTLMKLRRGCDDFELSVLFNISEKQVGEIFVIWVKFLRYQLSEINFWPSRKVVSDTMPENFRKQFPTTRVIIDATKIPINKPGDVNHQSSTFSTYKNMNTLKTLVGCTPRGLVSYVSDVYGGSTSDRQICES